MTSSISDFANAVRQRPLRRYDRLYDYPETEAIAAAEAARSTGRYVYCGIEVRLERPFAEPSDELPRSRRMAIQAWHHLEPLFVGLDRTNDDFYRTALKVAAVDWMRNSGLLWKSFLQDVGNGRDDNNEDFSAYAIAVSARTYRLAFLVDSLIVEGFPSEDWSDLLTLFLEHAHSFEEDGSILRRHNHGLFQLAHIIAGTSRFYNIGVGDRLLSGGLGTEDIYWRASRQFHALFQIQIKPDGSLPEHSAGYQMLVTRLLGKMIDCGFVNDKTLIDLFARMKELCNWMFDPEGKLIALGDTPEAIEKIASDYQTGPTETGSSLFREGGYWFIRQQATSQGDSYLAQTAAFHSRTHKHCDSGAVVWHDLGRPILIDAGSFGYLGRTPKGSPLQRDGFWYADPRRVHVESARAHNTIEIDGRNHRRYRQEAFGATITEVLTVDGVQGSRCAIPNAGAAQHHRFVLLRPGEWLIVVDTCRFARKSAIVRQWFQFHPRWLKSSGPGLCMEDGAGKLYLMPLLAGTAVERVWRGDRFVSDDAVDPGYRGWWAPCAGQFEPCTSVSVAASGTFLSLATLISLGDTPPIVGGGRANATHRAFLFDWQSGLVRHRLRLKTEGFSSPSFSIEYKVHR
ncbi:heparinase II/III family protein [Stappia sp. MMSF_3263]|uniref:heparinase II/III domain-containing protein n=1 Tax=Stappia sp. MMSF_3263 TaxID=3046693 RepID=UPI00273E4F41|nr:heparinase II/III family protein [Stappia sp. MMSF_3263]